MRTAFERLHIQLQRHLYDQQWEELRPIQVEAIQYLLDHQGDCIIGAATASGKTEAAFLPILSQIADDPWGSVRAMYIGPLKALINDQFRRIEELCQRLEVPVYRWHGDVSQSAKSQLRRKPGGVLLITPESLEAMFVNRATEIPKIFGQLRFVVIDELHAFMGTERGAQLKSLLARMQRRSGCNATRIGLSATLGDPEAAKKWLRPNATAHYIGENTARNLKLKAYGAWIAPDSLEVGDDQPKNVRHQIAREDTLRALSRKVLLAIKHTSALVFANSKGNIELFADAMREHVQELGIEQEIVVHHGSLSKEIREDAEASLQDKSRPTIAICSNTLEMGIDIGDVQSVVQITAPPSVAALVQRIGRSGRKSNTSTLRAYFTAQKPDARTSIEERLHLDFLQGIASIDLWLSEKFLESPALHRVHRSTMVQQTLSIIKETGGLPTLSLYERLSESDAFGPLAPKEFALFLRTLAARELICQLPPGDLILAHRGEGIVGHYEFYAAFKSVEEVAIVHKSRQLGRLPADKVPPVGDHIVLAGRRWRIESFDIEQKEVSVVPSVGRNPPSFNGVPLPVHRRVHEKMLELLNHDQVPSYIDEVALEILTHARETARKINGFRPRVQAAGRIAYIWLWAGSPIAHTLELALESLDSEDQKIAISNFSVGLKIENTDDVRGHLARIVDEPPDPKSLAAIAANRHNARMAGEKYDHYLPDAMWCEAYVCEHLALDETIAFVREMLRSES
jgi:ATP-dependent Lhr-like helicase